MRAIFAAGELLNRVTVRKHVYGRIATEVEARDDGIAYAGCGSGGASAGTAVPTSYVVLNVVT